VPHKSVGIEVCHTSMVVWVVDHGVWWHLLVRLLNETSQVCLGQMVWVWVDQEELCTSILTVRNEVVLLSLTNGLPLRFVGRWKRRLYQVERQVI
jgi:hypothetical protein